MAATSSRDRAIVLGRYEVVEVIGSGASGRVLHVVDRDARAPRALKLGIAGDALLFDEFAQLARLEHPSLPRVFEVGRTNEAIGDVPAGAPFFVAEWIAGGRCDARTWTTPSLWSLCADIAGALATIHAAGIVHGDVAPQNVLVADAKRSVLVDLGFASGGAARGTPAYMAPEALAGAIDVRGDLYGLGATLVRLATGRPPFEAATLGELAHAIVSASGPPALPELPAPFADLIARLVARDVDARPASALAVLDELDQIAPAIGVATARRARPAVGAAPAPTAWPGAREVIDTIARDLASDAAAIAVVGVAASGAREIADGAVRRRQLAEVASRRSPLAVVAGTLDDVARALGVAADAARDAGSHGFVERLARAARVAAPLVVIDLGGDPRANRAIAALARSHGGDGARPVVAIVDRAPEPRPGVTVRAAPILDDDGVARLAAAMLGQTPPRAWASALRAACGGLPLTAIELVRSIGGEIDPLAVDWAARVTAGAIELRARQLAAVGDAARRVALAIAVWGGRARVDRVLATARDAVAPGRSIASAGEAAARAAGGDAPTLADVVELQRAGLVHRRGGELAIDRATADAIEASEHARVPALAAAGLAAAGDAPLDVLAPLVERAPQTPEVVARACAVAEHLLARGLAERARAVVARAAASSGRAALIGARAAAAAGAYKDVAPLARRAEAGGADPVEARLAIARAAQRAGELDDAERALAELHAAHPMHAEVAGAYARLLVTRARFTEARDVATAGDAPLAGLRAEAAGLAAFYLGELADAERAFAALEVGGAAAGDDATVGRALSLRGMVAQQRGQLGLASDCYRDAGARLVEIGEVHAAAVADLNLGTVLAERGRASDALPRLVAAGRVFAELGATTEQMAAELNRGAALIALGQLAEGCAAAEAALAHGADAPHLRAFALLVLGDAELRLGADAAAIAHYREALAIGVAHGDAHAQASAHVALAEAGVATADDVDALCASDDDRDRWTLARGRLALHGGGTDRASDAALARACAAVAARAGDADRLERAFRGYALAARLATRADEAAVARTWAERARAAHAGWAAAAAPAFRAALDADTELARLPAPAAPSPSRALAWHDGTPHLRRLLALSRRLNTEASVERILDEVIDTAIELTAAERGFLLLRQPGGELAPVVSRNFAAADLEVVDRSVSRSIAEQAAATGEPVLTVDAGVDARFAVAASVAAMRLRSVLAVPLRQRQAIIGCIYVDHRLRGGAFDDAAATVLGELADIAAVAIENARLTDDLRRSTREVDDLNRRLGAELAERDAELVRVKAELPDRDRLRHRYERIVGRAPTTVRMLELVDRAAATSLPVVIVGESGTGKELVARALHDNGPRRTGAFVALNCSAVPESLLESELFGAARGAFTGADRDRRGLFEVADGGTLFLDEIAEMGAAMQAKLLRALQDGSIRRVGETRTRIVDVRVVVASQRPLVELVTAGRFRDDLRFRLEVIVATVPPLRERDGDVPLLVEHLLSRLCADRAPPRLTRAAQRALALHRWPGNVRELDNALARAIAMGGDVIDVVDLPEAIAAAAARPEPQKPALADDLRLRPALLATEQAYIAAAMTRAKNNQTVAARLLGLSRFGLQKKLRRLAGEADAADGDEA